MIDLTGVQWRKSTRSQPNGSCVEVAVLGAARRRKSSRSNNRGNCVEVANLFGVVAVRDSKHPDGPALTVIPSEWSSFLTGIRQGGFDL